MRLPAWRRGCLSAALLLAALAAPAAALQDFAAVLPRLQPQVRADLQRRSLQWRAMDQEQKQALQLRMGRWDALPLQQRRALRESYAAWRGLTPNEQARLREVSERFTREPPERQQAIRARFDALDRSARRGWLLGPMLGADYAALQPLLAQLPVEDHVPMLRTLRAMTAEQRGELAVLVQRTPPPQREALRRELLSTAGDQRQHWLWERLDQ